MRHYLKFVLCNSAVGLSIVCFLAGGAWLWAPFLGLVALAHIGDDLLPPDMECPSYQHTWLLDAFLWANLPLLLLANFCLLWQWADADVFNLGAHLDQLFGWQLQGRKLATQTWHRVGGFLGLGLLFGVAATNVAHELVHRTWSPRALELGRWFLAFTWDAAFAVEHVYGHHQKIATWDDPASARRGESFFHFLVRSTGGQQASAWNIERAFCRKKNRPFWSVRNRLLRGWFISLLYAVLSATFFGWPGLLLQGALALSGKCYLELVNFIEHYGLVRLPQSPVQAHHSWNSNASISSWFLFNLTRHSHHHEKGYLPFWRLEPQAHAPRLPYGYMTMILIALIPAWHRKIMQPCLSDWDQNWATAAEKTRVSSI